MVTRAATIAPWPARGRRCWPRPAAGARAAAHRHPARHPAPPGRASRGCSRDRAWREGRGSPGEDGQAIPTSTALERARSHNPNGHDYESAPVEEGSGIPSPGSRGERLLPIQVDSRRSTSRPNSRSARARIGACVPRAQSDDRAWSTRVVRDRSVTNLRVGTGPCQFRFTHQRL